MKDEQKKTMRTGLQSQERARKMLRVPDREFAASNMDEELWNSEVQFEVKAGKQVDKVASLFFRIEEQTEQNKQTNHFKYLHGTAKVIRSQTWLNTHNFFMLYIIIM